jgi:hypothetical protein
VALRVGFGLEGGDHCLDWAVPLMAGQDVTFRLVGVVEA